MRPDLFAAAAIAIIMAATPAQADEEHMAPYLPYEDTDMPRFDPAAREAWLADCRRRLSAGETGAGGALIGGAAGGSAGKRISGRSSRATGTIAGAAAGAAVGAAIDNAEDLHRDRDACEAYLQDYYARDAHGAYYQPHGYPYASGYAIPAVTYANSAAGCCMTAQPKVMVPTGGEPQCTETVEYVYEDIPARPAPGVRHIPRRSKAVPDKRVPVR